MAERVAVIGGGPGGATAAAILARHGVDVVLFEQARFPRHHVGESLQPATLDVLERHLGVEQQIRDAGFGRKYGAVYVWGDSRAPWSVLFDERLDQDLPGLTEAGLLGGGYEHAVNVDRARFDAILLDAARASGVDVREGTRVDGVLRDGDRVTGVRVGTEDVAADVVIDASGQSCIVGRALGTTRVVNDLRCTATYGYYTDAGGLPGPLGRHVQYVVTLDDGWAWFIPTSPDTTSVGIVLRSGAPLDRARFEALVAEADLPIAGGTLLTDRGRAGLFFARDWSFNHHEVAGDGWVMVGDAACFVDPILSGGVDAAVRGGASAALALLRGFQGGPVVRDAALSSYNDQVRTEYKAYLRLARYWYGNNRSVDGFFWQAQRELAANAGSVPVRAFVYLTSGRYAADKHFKVFQRWQEERMFRALGVTRAQVERARGAPASRVNLVPRGRSGRRLELFIASGCNLHCSFCCESDRIKQKRFMEWDEIDRKLTAAATAGVEVIQFMGGEATLHPRFADALRRARELGLGTYVITNLMRWRQRDFAESVGPWLDEVMVSMHAWGEDAGATVTGIRGWWRGFGEASANAQATLEGRVRCSTVLTRHNVDDLERIGEHLMTFAPTAWVMGSAVPVVGTREDALDINLSVTELRALRPRFEALSRRCADAGCKLIFFAMPHCVVGPTLWDDSHDLWLGDQDLSDSAPSDIETVTFWSKADDLPRPRPVTLGRTRPAACDGCLRAPRCGGHFSAYFARHGTGELEPILA